MLLDELDRADRVGLGRREQLLEPAPDHVGPAEGVRRAHDREQVEALLEPRQRPGDPLDVGRGRRRVLRRAGGTGRRRRTSARPSRSRSLSVETTMRSKTSAWRAVSIAYASSGCPASRRTFFPGRAPSRRARRSALRRSASPPPRGAARAPGSATPSRSPARTTEPVIASSSVGRPARASRAVEVVSIRGHGLDDRPLRRRRRARHRPPPRPRTPPRAPARRRRRHAGSAAERADRQPLTRRRRGERRRRPRRLLPEHRALAVADDDLDPGHAERRERSVERVAVDRVAGGVTTAPVRVAARRRRARRVRLDAARCAATTAAPSGRARRRRGSRSTCSRPFRSGSTTAPRERLRRDAVERVVEGVRLDRDDEQPRPVVEALDGLRRARPSARRR